MKVIKHILKDLSTNKLRTFLTIIGISIAIASVTILVSLGESAQKLITDELSNRIDERTIWVRPGSDTNMMSPTMFLDNFSESDYTTLKKVLDTNIIISRRAQATGHIDYASNKLETLLLIVDPRHLDILNIKVDGNPLSQIKGSNKIIISDTVQRKLFPIQDPIDKKVLLNNKEFIISGISHNNSSGNSLTSAANIVYITTESYKKIFNKNPEIGALIIQFETKSQKDQFIPVIKKILRQQHQLEKDDEDDFTIETREGAIKEANTILGALTAFITAVSAISLFVGGIGVMNIMLVSVKERIKEIGLRKAVGATNRDIRNQILIESVVFSLLGGLVGILIGNAGAIGLEHLADLPTKISLQALLMSIGVTVVVGLVFGLYPAITAAKLSPIEALRSE